MGYMIASETRGGVKETLKILKLLIEGSVSLIRAGGV